MILHGNPEGFGALGWGLPNPVKAIRKGAKAVGKAAKAVVVKAPVAAAKGIASGTSAAVRGVAAGTTAAAKFGIKTTVRAGLAPIQAAYAVNKYAVKQIVNQAGKTRLASDAAAAGRFAAKHPAGVIGAGLVAAGAVTGNPLLIGAGVKAASSEFGPGGGGGAADAQYVNPDGSPYYGPGGGAGGGPGGPGAAGDEWIPGIPNLAVVGAGGVLALLLFLPKRHPGHGHRA
jgi:hypothetical protein